MSVKNHSYERKLLIACQLLVFFLLFNSFLAMSEEIISPSALMKERKQNYSGWGSSKVDMEMTLLTATGEKSVRKLRNLALEVDKDGDKSITIFDEPLDVSGVALLSHSHIVGSDDQWLFLPSLKRTKRISSSNKSGSFMGSEFAFEDMNSFECEKYEGSSVREDMLENKPVYIMELKPVYTDSGYTRLVTWLDKEHKQPVQVEFYDHKNSLLKTLRVSDYKRYKNSAWRAHKLDMRNMQTGKSTQVKFSDFNFDASLTDADFNKNVFNKIR